MKIDAVLWDYDGTLVNSVPKNIDITKQILAVVAPRLTGDNLPLCLQSEQNYHRANHQAKNWQDLYVNYYGMTEMEMLQAGALWSEYQLANQTPVELFAGIRETINQIRLPQGICSQNSAKNIQAVLEKSNLSAKINAIIGYDDIPSDCQKPHAFSGLQCLNQIFSSLAGLTVLYVGDHEGDVLFALNIQQALPKSSSMLAVAVKYSGAEISNWQHQPDFAVDSPLELLKVIADLNCITK